MKKLLLILSFSLLTIFVNAQVDSTVRKTLDTLEVITSVKEFNSFLYRSMTAEKYDEFIQYYNYFMSLKYNDWILRRKKPN